jgi:hypothetical protein
MNILAPAFRPVNKYVIVPYHFMLVIPSSAPNAPLPLIGRSLLDYKPLRAPPHISLGRRSLPFFCHPRSHFCRGGSMTRPGELMPSYYRHIWIPAFAGMVLVNRQE